ncbi:MAG TPA: hypothetical protein PLV25_06210, partial [Opitutales bacterium]|nr:hypothetical protein [Opitutales bacterium]
MPSDRPLKVIIFGTALSAYNASIQFLNDPRIEVLGFYDNDERRWGKKFMGLDIYAPKPKSECSADIVYIGSSFKEAIHKQLKMLGYGHSIVSDYDQLMAKLATHYGKKQPPQLPPTFDTQLFPKILSLAQAQSYQIPYEETQNASFDGTLAVTACANNQLALAIVLARSFLKEHPEGRVI